MIRHSKNERREEEGVTERKKKGRVAGLGKMREEWSDGVGQIEVQKGNILQEKEKLF